MSLFIPPVAPLPQAPSAPAPQQAPSAVQAAAAVTALPVGIQQTRVAATASGNAGGSTQAKDQKGRKADNEANATETKTDARADGLRRRGLGRKADLSV